MAAGWNAKPGCWRTKANTDRTNPMQEFSAKIFKVGINPCVDAPEEVSRALSKRGYLPVKGMLNSYPFRANLVPIGGGRHRLFLNAEMRKGAKADTGDTVQVALEIDTEPRELAVPDDLAEALQ